MDLNSLVWPDPGGGAGSELNSFPDETVGSEAAGVFFRTAVTKAANLRHHVGAGQLIAHRHRQCRGIDVGGSFEDLPAQPGINKAGEMDPDIGEAGRAHHKQDQEGDEQAAHNSAGPKLARYPNPNWH